MRLQARAKKSNGTNSSDYWYVCKKYTDSNGMPNFTISLDRNKAAYFTKEEAEEFNRLFMRLGIIDKPFEISK